MKRKGYSLIEMIIVIAIFSILTGVVTEFIIKTMRDNKKLQVQATVQSDINLALDKFNRVSRSSTKLLEANQTNFKVLGYPKTSDTAPSQINFYLDGQALRYSVTPPTGTPPNYTYNPSDAKVVLLLAKVNNTASDPLLFYYDDMNLKINFPVNLADIRVVEFTPGALDADNVLKDPIKVTTSVMLRNFKTNL